MRKERKNRQIKPIMIFLTAGFLTLGSLTGCGNSVQKKDSMKDQLQDTKETSSEVESSANFEKKLPLTMEEKNRVLSLDELQKYSDQRYISCNMLDLGEDEILVDGYGNATLGRNVGNPYVKRIEDVCSQEVVYYEECYVTKDPSDDDEDGVPHSRLYDAEGNMIRDWKDVDYGPACGDWIIIADYYLDTDFENPMERKFTNLKTGEVMNGVHDLALLDSKRVNLFDMDYHTLAVMDQNGNLCLENVISKGKPENALLFEKNGYYYTNVEKEGEGDENSYICTFYDGEGKETFSVEENNYIDFFLLDTVGPYITATIDSGDKVWDLRGDGNGGCKELYQASSITYYDGERIVADHDGDYTYGIFDADGKKLADFEGKVYPEYGTDRDGHSEKAETFLAIDGDKMKRVDRDGKELASIQIDTSGLRIMEIEIYKEAIYYCTEDYEHMGLLTKDLKEILPFDEFLDAGTILDERTGVEYFYVSRNGLSKNLYTMSGELILENLGGIQEVRDGVALVYKGKYFGFMGLNGKWIQKYSFLDYMDQWM